MHHGQALLQPLVVKMMFGFMYSPGMKSSDGLAERHATQLDRFISCHLPLICQLLAAFFVPCKCAGYVYLVVIWYQFPERWQTYE